MLDLCPRRRMHTSQGRADRGTQPTTWVLALAVLAAWPLGCTARGLQAGRSDGRSDGSPSVGDAPQPPDGSSGGGAARDGADAAVAPETGAGGASAGATGTGPADKGGTTGGGGATGVGGGSASGGSAGKPDAADGAVDAGGVDGARPGAGGTLGTGGLGAGGTLGSGGLGAGGTLGTGGRMDASADQTGGRDGGAADRWRGLDTGKPSQLIADPEIVDFGYVELKETATAVVSVFNTGVSPIAPSMSMLGNLFTIDSACPLLLDGGEACQVTVRFSPIAPGLATTALDIGDTMVSLRGIGIDAATFTATDRFDLGTVLVGQVIPVVVEIVPDATLSRLACVAGGGDLTLASQTCPKAGVVTEPCSFTYAFEATGTGQRTDAVICTGPGGNTTATLISALALGRPALTIQPSSATLATTLGGTATARFTVANGGEGTCTDLFAKLTVDSVDFAIVATDCSPPLPPLATCVVEVAFSPTSIGLRRGALAAHCETTGTVANLLGTVAD